MISCLSGTFKGLIRHIERNIINVSGYKGIAYKLVLSTHDQNIFGYILLYYKKRLSVGNSYSFSLSYSIVDKSLMLSQVRSVAQTDFALFLLSRTPDYKIRIFTVRNKADVLTLRFGRIRKTIGGNYAPYLILAFFSCRKNRMGKLILSKGI